MSKELKDLIDKAEEEQQSRAYLEKTIEKLQLEVDKLKSKLNAQKIPFKPTPIKHITEESESEEILILKKTIFSLSEKLEKREEEKELLQDKVKDLTLELDELKESLSDSLKDEMLSRTQNSLNTLIQDYGRLEQENKSLKKKVFELSKEIEGATIIESSLQSESSKNEQLKNEIVKLKQNIANLERSNKSLATNLDLIKTKQVSAEELDKIVESLKVNNLNLEEENKALNEKLNALKREKLKIFKLESQISDLGHQIEELQLKNKELREKDTILLAKTITALQHHDKKESVKPESKSIELTPITEDSIEEQEAVITKIKELSTNVIKPYIADAVIESRKITKEEEVLETEELEEEEEESDFTRKWQCPNCGNSNKTHIREIDDKTRLIFAYPKIYAKKYKCGQCGAEWK
ncbi:MAG: hypothetical protein ACFE8E_06985 [Candidatus Hodarchaeota archaeon]